MEVKKWVGGLSVAMGVVENLKVQDWGCLGSRLLTSARMTEGI